MRGILSPESGLLYVCDAVADRITPVLINNRRVLRPIQVGQQPMALRFTPGGRLLLVLNQGSDDLSVVGMRTGAGSLLTMIPVGHQPRELVVQLF